MVLGPVGFVDVPPIEELAERDTTHIDIILNLPYRVKRTGGLCDQLKSDGDHELL